MPDAEKTRPATAAIQFFSEHLAAHTVLESGHGGAGEPGRGKNRRGGLFFSRRPRDLQIRRVGFSAAAFAAEQSCDVDGDEVAGAQWRNHVAPRKNVARERRAAKIQAEPGCGRTADRV